MDIKSLLNLNFWINLSPNPLLLKSFRLLELVFLALIFLAAAAKIVSVVKKSDYLIAGGAKKMVGPFFWMGVFGLALLLMDYERVMFLSGRFWYLLWLIGFAVWLFLRIKKLARDLPERKRAIDKQKNLEKWLPKRK